MEDTRNEKLKGINDISKKERKIIVNKKKVILGLVVIISIISAAFIVYQVNSLSFCEIDFSDVPKTVDHGKIYRTSSVDGVQGHLVMDLNGSYAEMGYAHGALAGKYIIYSIEYMIRAIYQDNLIIYNEFSNIINSPVCIRNTTYHSEEVEAIYQACVDIGYNMFVPSLMRDWTLEDLWMLNAIMDSNQEVLGCSGFGIWDSASNLTNGKTFIGRDLDFPIDPRGLVTQLLMLIIYRSNGTRPNDVFTFSVPGIICSITGFNDKGVWLSSDNSNGIKTASPGRTAMGIGMRNFLEIEDGVNVMDDALDFFLSLSPYQPFLFLLGCNESIQDPVVVLEGNDGEVINRTGTQENHDYVYLTNHQRNLTNPISCVRYSRYTEKFMEFTADSGTISVEEGVEMLKYGGGKTVLSVIFIPETLEFYFGNSFAQDGGSGLFWSSSLKYAFDHPLMDQKYCYYDF